MYVFYVCVLAPLIQNGFSLSLEATDLKSLSRYEASDDIKEDYDIWNTEDDAGIVIFDSISKPLLEQICKDSNNLVYITEEDVTIDCKAFKSERPIEKNIIKRSAEDEDKEEGSGEEPIVSVDENKEDQKAETAETNEAPSIKNEENKEETQTSINEPVEENKEPPAEETKNENKVESVLETQVGTEEKIKTEPTTVPEHVLEPVHEKVQETIIPEHVHEEETIAPVTNVPEQVHEHVHEEETTIQETIIPEQVHEETILPVTNVPEQVHEHVPENNQSIPSNNPDNLEENKPVLEATETSTKLNEEENKIPHEETEVKTEKEATQTNDTELINVPNAPKEALQETKVAVEEKPHHGPQKGKTLISPNPEKQSNDFEDDVKTNESTTQKAGSKDTTILVVLFVAVLVVGALAFGYNFIKKRRQRSADLERVERVPSIKRSLQNLAKDNNEAEKKPLMSDKKEVEMVDMKKRDSSSDESPEKAPNELTIKT